MQRHHAILPEMHQVASGDQRPRVPRPVQVVSFLPHGSVRLVFLLSYQPRHFPHTAEFALVASAARIKGGKDLVRPTCHRSLDRFVGTQVILRREAREKPASHSWRLVGFETTVLSNRHTSSLLRAPRTAYLSTSPLLLLHRLGSSRWKPNIPSLQIYGSYCGQC